MAASAYPLQVNLVQLFTAKYPCAQAAADLFGKRHGFPRGVAPIGQGNGARFCGYRLIMKLPCQFTDGDKRVRLSGLLVQNMPGHTDVQVLGLGRSNDFAGLCPQHIGWSLMR